MSVVTKAVRAKFFLGDIELDGFQLPNGSYCLNQAQVTAIVNKDKKSMRDFLASESPYALPYKHLSGGKSKGTFLNKIKVEGDSAQNITEVPLELAFAFWLKESVVGNIDASNLVFACGIESLERRLDKAFDVQRTEEERNERFKERMIHKKQFHPLLTRWLQADGCQSGREYGVAVNKFKANASLPLKSVNEYDSDELHKLNNAEVRYDILRVTGMSHEEAMKFLR